MTEHHIYNISDTAPFLLTPNGVHSGLDVTIQSINDSGYIYIGSSSVTQESFGYRIAAGHAISFELPGKDALYAIASEPNMRVAVIQIGLESQD